MRSWCAALLASSLIVSGAYAAERSAPLAPGKPAGVKEAQAQGNLIWWIGGLAIVGTGVGLLASGSGNDGVTTTTTTSTAP
jgi:hypothetical protein